VNIKPEAIDHEHGEMGIGHVGVAGTGDRGLPSDCRQAAEQIKITRPPAGKAAQIGGEFNDVSAKASWGAQQWLKI
jgi:hypothetical protein